MGFPPKPTMDFWCYPKALNGYWSSLSGAEQKVLDYILRHTWGFEKTADDISLTQLEKGIKGFDNGTGLSRNGVITAIKKLVAKGFISKSKGEKANHYELVRNLHYPSAKNALPASAKNAPTIDNVTIDNKQYIATPSVADKDRRELTDMFKEVNPSYRKLFERKNQGDAIRRLVSQWGREKIEWVIKILPKTNQMKYAPVITTPIQLEDNLGKLIAFLKKEGEDNKVISAKTDGQSN